VALRGFAFTIFEQPDSLEAPLSPVLELVPTKSAFVCEERELMNLRDERLDR